MYTIFRKFVEEKALRYLAHLHKICFRKFGIIKIKNKCITAEHKTWKEYLKNQSQLWITSICQSSNKLEKIFKRHEVQKKIRNILTNKRLFVCKYARLVHGDMLNPGNILIQNNKITGIIDFEWAITGDPAWEFAFKKPRDLSAYYEEASIMGCKIPEKLFEEKIRLYHIFWLLWGIHVHIDGYKQVQQVLLNQFLEQLDNYDLTVI